MSADSLARSFAALRPYLMRLAYSQLGSLADADDVVQEAWLRLERADHAAIVDLRAWLTTVVGRLALDALGAARMRRAAYVGEWLPDPLLSVPTGDADPADRVTLDESVSFALLAVLERLSPAERTAFVLHDVFGMPFEAVAAAVGRRPEAARQLAARARRHVGEHRPRFTTTPEQQSEAVAAFATATRDGDLEALLQVLDLEVVPRSDGGGKVAAARKPLLGADRVARAILAFARAQPDATACWIEVNGLPGLLVEGGGETSAFSFTVDGGRIIGINIVRNPDKLRRVVTYG